jgi:hypothetical protein
MSELYTKLFVESEVSHRELLSFVASACGGKVEAPWTVVAGAFEMDVRPNNDSTEVMRRSHPGEFIYFPYTVEVVGEGEPDSPLAYLSFVGSLMQRLHAAGMQVVAACDWESDLPGGGRLGLSTTPTQ